MLESVYTMLGIGATCALSSFGIDYTHIDSIMLSIFIYHMLTKLRQS